MNTRRIRILIPLAVVALIGVGVWQWQSHQQDQKDRIQITANGTVEADEVEVGSQRSARLAMYRVEEGQPVKKGDVIAMLDTSELKAQLDQARGGVLLASGKLKELLRGTRSEELRHAAAQVEQARASVGGADRSLENARKGYHRRTQLKQALDAASTQRRQAEAALKQAESTLAGAEDAVKTAQQDYDTSVQLRQTRDGAAQALESSRAQSRNAQAKLTELVNGERPEVIAAAEAALGQTEQAMRQARDEAANAASDFQRVDEEHRGNAASDQQLDAARTRSETAKAKLGQAEQARTQAQAKLAELKNGTRTEQIAAAKAAAEQAEANVQGNEKGLRNAQEALELRLGAQSALNTARTQRNVAEAQVANARSGLGGAELASQNSRIAYGDALSEKQAVDTAFSQYAGGVAQLKAAEAQLSQLKNGATKEETEQVRGQLQQARGQLEMAKVQFDQSVIRAPRDGVITQHVAEVGEVVTPGATVAKLVPLDHVYLTLYAPLPDLGRVKLGQKVDVTADSYPGKSYQGEVERISDTPEFTPRNVQTKDERVKLVFQIRVKVTNPNRELKPGMPADAVIHLQ